MTKPKFEEAMAQLEKITLELEEGELNLEQSLRKFEEGIRLVESCRKTLDQAEKRVEILLRKNGEILAKPFSDDDGPADSTGPSATPHNSGQQ